MKIAYIYTKNGFIERKNRQKFKRKHLKRGKIHLTTSKSSLQVNISERFVTGSISKRSFQHPVSFSTFYGKKVD